jgi:hypothetical protein
MTGDKVPTWLRYAMALVVAVGLGLLSAMPDLELPTPQDPGWTPLVGLLHSLVVGVSFSLIIVAVTVLLNRAPENLWARSLRRGVPAFLLFALGDFALEISSRPFFSEISRHPDVQHAIARAVLAGRGALVPVVLLLVFYALFFFKRQKRM